MEDPAASLQTCGVLEDPHDESDFWIYSNVTRAIALFMYLHQKRISALIVACEIVLIFFRLFEISLFI